MTPEKDAELRRKYPLVFQRPLINMEPIRCGDGWLGILDTLCADLTALIKETGAECRRYYAEQVKEKFGGLRFYMSRTTGDMDEAIARAERTAWNTCEECGEPGTTQTRGWIRTLCETHMDPRR